MLLRMSATLTLAPLSLKRSWCAGPPQGPSVEPRARRSPALQLEADPQVRIPREDGSSPLTNKVHEAPDWTPACAGDTAVSADETITRE